MSIQKNYPVPRLVYSATSLAATANSGALDGVQADAYGWILDVGTATGTSPTLDVAIQISPDGGTTWYSVSRFAQATGSAVKLFKTHCNGPITGQAAAVATIADTGGALESNFPVTAKIRILATVGGTNPSFTTVKLYMIPIYNNGRYQ